MNGTEREADRSGNEEALNGAQERLEKRLDEWRDKHYGAEGEEDSKMNGFNRVVMVGRVTRDPEVKQTTSGRAVTDLFLAVNENYKGKDGEQAERTCFIEVAAWGRLAKACGEYLKKGRPILVEGRLRLDRWQAADGQKRSKHRITADRIQFLSGSRKNDTVTADEPSSTEAVSF